MAYISNIGAGGKVKHQRFTIELQGAGTFEVDEALVFIQATADEDITDSPDYPCRAVVTATSGTLSSGEGEHIIPSTGDHIEIIAINAATVTLDVYCEQQAEFDVRIVHTLREAPDQFIAPLWEASLRYHPGNIVRTTDNDVFMAITLVDVNSAAPTEGPRWTKLNNA